MVFYRGISWCENSNFQTLKYNSKNLLFYLIFEVILFIYDCNSKNRKEMKDKVEKIERVIDKIILALEDKFHKSTEDVDKSIYQSDINKMKEWKLKVYDVYNDEDLKDRMKDDMLTTYLEMFENTLKITIR
jgi:hypothetical protein